MQFFYQFPQRIERLALVSSGGLGHEVSPLLRGAALPGAAALLWLVAQPRVVARRSPPPASGCAARGSRKGVYLQAIARALRPLQEPGGPPRLPADAALGDRRPAASASAPATASTCSARFPP